MSLKDFIEAREAAEEAAWKAPQPPNWIKVEEPAAAEESKSDDEIFSPEVDALQKRLLEKIRQKYADFDSWNKSFGYAFEFIIQWSYYMITELNEAADKENCIPAKEARAYYKQVYEGAIHLVEEWFVMEKDDCRKYGDFSKIHALIDRELEDFEDNFYTHYLIAGAFTYELAGTLDYGIEKAESEKGIFNRKEKNQEIQTYTELKSMVEELRELMSLAEAALNPNTSEYE